MKRRTEEGDRPDESRLGSGPAEPTDVGDFRRARPKVVEASTIPRRIGRYTVLELIGRGGMGAVYLAEQTEPRRRVAVKVIRSTHADAHSAYRFDAERQALARMSHPSIAQVYEAGDTESGEPFFAMEHVPGEPIDRYCDRQRLTVDQRLELFVAVCRGIHHAHQKGILHRDVKPDNVLVTDDHGRPVPKIIDFGVAKVLDEASGADPATRGVVLGTPSYLSPESVAVPEGGADPDTRSDVYSLGVMLFELLVGSRPFGRSGESIEQILQQVSDGEVPAPSVRWRSLAENERDERAARRGAGAAAIARRLRGDLDWIVLKATARRREQRYDSAAELAADLERHRRHAPVRAAPPSRLYVLGRFLRRYRSAVTASALIVLALAAGIAARTLEARRAGREAAAARQAQAETQQVIDFLIELFEVDPDAASGDTVTARELLDRGAETIRRRLGDQPLTRAQLLDTIGRVYRHLDLPQPATPLLEDALTIRERLLGPDHPDVATSLDHLGDLYWIDGDYDAAEAALLRALDIRKRIFGADHLAVAEVLDHLGSVYEIQAEYAAAEPLLLRALDIRERQLDDDHPLVAASLDDLGVLELDRGDYDAAEPLLRRALEIRQRRLGPDHPQVAVSANGLGIVLSQLERQEESAAMFRTALAVRERAFGEDSAPVAQSLNNLANVYLDLGHDQEAEAALVRAGAIWEETLGPEHPRVGIVLTNLGDLFLGRGEPGRAEPLFRRAATIFATGYGPEHPNLAYPLQGLAESLHRQGRTEAAREPCRQAVAIRATALGPDDPQSVSTREDCEAWLGSADLLERAVTNQREASPAPG